VTSITWGHNDKRLFVATGVMVHIAWVSRRVASLQLLSRLQVASALPMGEASVKKLPLPPRLKHLISNLFAQTIRVSIYLSMYLYYVRGLERSELGGSAQGAFGTDFYDRSILCPKHRAYYRSGRPTSRYNKCYHR